jgi:cytochrome c-type biogenesis protein CcmH
MTAWAASSSGAGGRRAMRWLPWLALVAVAVIALAIGTQRHDHPSLQSETTSIASAVRCPVCSGETAAESDTSISISIRSFIRRELVAGESRSQILSQLSASYGPGILEKPPAKGINLLLWILPIVAVVLAVGGLGVVFTRWRVARAKAVSEADRRLVTDALGEASPDPPVVPT